MTQMNSRSWIYFIYTGWSIETHSHLQERGPHKLWLYTIQYLLGEMRMCILPLFASRRWSSSQDELMIFSQLDIPLYRAVKTLNLANCYNWEIIYSFSICQIIPNIITSLILYRCNNKSSTSCPQPLMNVAEIEIKSYLWSY